MIAKRTLPTSPCKGEFDREASRRGSRFSRTRAMTVHAKKLRLNMTEAESRLWRVLRRGQLNDLHFRRQHPVGLFTLDFYCPSLRLAIEVDGGQHAARQKRADERRTHFLLERGITVVRYWNNDVFTNSQGVLADLVATIEKRKSEVTPSPSLPLSGGGSTATPRDADGGTR
jgi:very-short-patch-repair endonuclease